MHLKNHTTPRLWQLTGDRGDTPAYAPGTTYKFNLKDVPPLTRRMANYIVGLIVTLDQVVFTYREMEEVDGQLGTNISDADIIAGLFESAEVQQSMFGTPVSSNHYLGRYFGLFGYVGNGMQDLFPGQVAATTSSSNVTRSLSFFVPLSALNGMKGHHTAQLACCYDRAQFMLRTCGQGAFDGIAWVSGGTLQVSAVVCPEPEVRLGPGTQFVLYKQTASLTGTTLTLDSLGNASTLEGVEQGAGIGMALWMSLVDRYGGAGTVVDMEYLNIPWRDQQQTRHLEPLMADWINACADSGQPFDVAGHGGNNMGHLYRIDYARTAGTRPLMTLAHFLPLVVPHRFLELSKLQVMQGSATINLKNVSGFSGEHVVAVQQYHSWTPAKIEDVLRKAVDSGVMQGVWGTNDVIPSVKIASKQPAGSINPAKTRFFALTWVPKETVASPPKQ